MLLYHGMYNIAHFEINNSVPLYTNTAVGDAYDYKRLRKVCFESGGAYISDSIIDGGHVRGGAHVTIQEDSIFLSIVPEDPNAGIVYGLTFFIGVDGHTMYAYAEKREGGGSGGSGVDSFNGRRGSVIPADGDYNAGMVGYDNTNSGLVADNTQDAIDELAQENENLSDDVETLQTDVGNVKEDVTSAQTAIDAINEQVEELSSARLIATASPDGVKTEGDLVKEIITVANNYDLDEKIRLIIKRSSRIYHPEAEAANNETFSHILHSTTNCRIYTMFVSGGAGNFIMRDLIAATNSDMSNVIATDSYYLYEI